MLPSALASGDSPNSRGSSAPQSAPTGFQFLMDRNYQKNRPFLFAWLTPQPSEPREVPSSRRPTCPGVSRGYGHSPMCGSLMPQGALVLCALLGTCLSS